MAGDFPAGRNPALSDLFTAAEAAIVAGAPPGSDARRTAEAVFGRLRARAGTVGTLPPARLPVCDWLDVALALGRNGPRGPVVQTLRALAPDLHWTRRQAAEGAVQPFADGHGNAMLCGPGGIEERGDLWVGVTLMAPGMIYAEHDHPPEEVYLSLTPGEWWNAAMDWTDPGATRLVYNPPGIRHAMRSGKAPFLALWFLPI